MKNPDRDRRTPLVAEYGKVYRNHGGGIFRCVDKHPRITDTKFSNVRSGRTFTAHGVRQYPDGTIEWDWSTGGHFEQSESDKIAASV